MPTCGTCYDEDEDDLFYQDVDLCVQKCLAAICGTLQWDETIWQPQLSVPVQLKFPRLRDIAWEDPNLAETNQLYGGLLLAASFALATAGIMLQSRRATKLFASGRQAIKLLWSGCATKWVVG